MVHALVNGLVADSVAITDRGVLYGDGVFETIAVIDGQLHYWQSHLQRLLSGCRCLGLGEIDVLQLQQECCKLIAGMQQGVLKIIITRGTGGRGYRVPEQIKATRIVQLHEWPLYPDSCQAEGIRTTLCTTRLGSNPQLAGIKHLNRLEQVMARREWNDDDIREGLMLDMAGQLIEGTMSNVFIVQDGCLMTPDLTQCGVAGIMRARVLELAEREKMNNTVQIISVDEMQQADEIFICNSLIGIWPVLAVDDCSYRKGPLTRRLQQLLHADCDVATHFVCTESMQS